MVIIVRKQNVEVQQNEAPWCKYLLTIFFLFLPPFGAN